MELQQGLGSLSASAKLAPEIILHILSFLMPQDQPSSLWPVLTVCKKWARLALELMYEQPTISFRNLGAFVNTLALQDRLQNGQKPFWDTNACPTTNPLNTRLGQNLGIDYRSMIKKPCCIVGSIAPVKQDLIHLWDLQALLWVAPAFSTNEFSASLTNGRNIITPSPPTPPSLPSPSSPQSPIFPTDSEQLTSPDNLENINQSKTFQPAPKRPTSPSQPKAVLVRQKKKLPPPIGPVVLFLDVSQVFTDTTHHVLDQVPGMKLRQLYYKSRLSVPLQDLLERNFSTLRELTFSRPPTRQDEFMIVAQLLSKATNIDTLRLDHCQAAGSTVLTQFARSCGVSLKMLEIRQNIVIRPLGDHSLFPVDGPEDWNLNPPEISSGHDDCVVSTSQEQQFQAMPFGQPCSHASPSEIINPATSIESVIDQLSISGDLGEDTVEAPTVDTIPADVDLESRMDLALKEFGLHCTRLSRLRLQHLTWLSDDALSYFKPQQGQGLPITAPEIHTQFQGLREIEILDSYYGSRLTIEGLLDLCGQNLEVLVLDRKSCWRLRPIPKEQRTMCPVCMPVMAYMSTGDQLISGLVRKRSRLYRSSEQTGLIRRLDTLVLIEHWVTLKVLKEAIEYWWLTLRVLNLRLFKCSIE
ncbi:hypothetical protein BGX26_003160, partial [Mortierella sp. AD094]